MALLPSLPAADRKTAELFGARVAEVTARWSKAATPRDPPLVHNAPMPYACGLLGPLPAAGPARIQTGPANTPEPIAGSVIG